MVAVLHTWGYGGGWYSWNNGCPEILFDPTIVAMVERTVPVEQIMLHIIVRYGDEIYTGGVDTLRIRWVPVGTRFRVQEYDGSERIILEEDHPWITA